MLSFGGIDQKRIQDLQALLDTRCQELAACKLKIRIDKQAAQTFTDEQEKRHAMKITELRKQATDMIQSEREQHACVVRALKVQISILQENKI